MKNERSYSAKSILIALGKSALYLLFFLAVQFFVVVIYGIVVAANAAIAATTSDAIFTSPSSFFFVIYSLEVCSFATTLYLLCFFYKILPIILVYYTKSPHICKQT